ncbi:MAG: hypothetical protein R3301_15585 [Saprospiraceae bacterium]|nr:hypothetical protein [Saprospiraceae bacterium]
MREVKWLIVTLLHILLTGLLTAQDVTIKAEYRPEPQRKPLCKPPRINLEAEALAATHRDALLRQATVDKLVRVYFHICRNDNGTNAAATLEDIESEFAELVADFAPTNICFANMGVDFVDDTQVNTMLDPDLASNEAWLQPYLVPGCLNIFYHANLLNYGGNAYSIPNTYCSIDQGNIGWAHTIAHEVGHCFGLLHTFEDAFGEGYINLAFCTTTGDKVCDTPADPYHEDDPCFVSAGCAYVGSCTDPVGATNYAPPYTNIMSYWAGEDCTVDELTSGQYARAHSFLETDIPLLGIQSPADLVYGPVMAASGYVMVSAIHDVSTSGSVELINNVEASLQGQNVLLLPGFVADPTTGRILIRSAACNY